MKPTMDPYCTLHLHNIIVLLKILLSIYLCDAFVICVCATDVMGTKLMKLSALQCTNDETSGITFPDVSALLFLDPQERTTRRENKKRPVVSILPVQRVRICNRDPGFLPLAQDKNINR